MNTRLIVRIALSIAVVGLFALALWRGVTPSVVPSASPSPVADTASASLPGPLAYAPAGAEWQSYSSSSLGFTVRYPRDWTTASCGSGCVAFALASDAEQLVMGISAGPGTLTDLLAMAAPYIIASESARVGTTDWLRLTLQQPQTGEIFTSHYVEHAGKLFEVGINKTDPALLNVYGSIIRSLTFTK